MCLCLWVRDLFLFVGPVPQEKLLGGYVLIKMCMDKDTWYIIKNSNHVQNFVGHDRARKNVSGGIQVSKP